MRGKRILQARTQAGLTLAELGKKIGVSAATVKRYESGEIINIPSDKIEAIARVTGVSASYLMGWDELKPANAPEHAKILKNPDIASLLKTYIRLSEENQKILNEVASSLELEQNVKKD